MSSRNKHPRKYREDGTLDPLWMDRNHKRRAGVYTWHPRFLAIDGEGGNVSLQGRTVHSYFLLGSSDGEKRIWLETSDPYGIPTRSALDWLCDRSLEYPASKFVCFSASYDVNMMLRDLTQAEIQELWRGSRITWRPEGSTTYYKLEYHHRRQFTVLRRDVRRGHVDRRGNWYSDNLGHVILYDVFGYFQTSFVKTLRTWLPEWEETIKLIASGKDRRSQFQVDELEYIKSYCGLELDALVALMDRLRDYLKDANMHPAKWYGVGALATVLFQQHKIKQYKSNAPLLRPRPEPAHVPTWREMRRGSRGSPALGNLTQEDAAYHAYFGGRIELPKYGRHMGTIYHYDLNSAYPAAIARLPALADGEWTYVRGPIAAECIHSFALYHVTWRLPETTVIGPFPYRMPWGSVYFPTRGEGWYWGPEVAQALRDYPDHVQIWERFVFMPAYNSWPFAFVRDMYDLRRQWKADGNPAEKVLKLGLNSLYGKFIQRIGWQLPDDAKNRALRLPAYHEIYWAGWVTSYTRARLYEAARDVGWENVISFQTDGLFSLAPLNGAGLGKSLGDWNEEPICDVITTVQSGVYFLRERDTGKSHAFYRGFDPDSISEEKVMEGWRNGQDTLVCRSTRFVTMGHVAFHHESEGSLPFREWRTWRSVPRNLRLGPAGTKRRDYAMDRIRPDTGLVSTLPMLNECEGMSTKYVMPWENWLRPDEILIDGITEQELEDATEESYA